MTRARLLDQTAGWVLATCRPHPLRVAVDGIDAAGKTTFADELAEVIGQFGRPVVRASIDDFHRPRTERYQHGKDSPQGYYLDSFNYPLLVSSLLLPLGPNGDRRFRARAFDHRTDLPVQVEPQTAAIDAVLIFDGVFLLRQELYACWDYRIFLQVEFERALARALQRDQGLFGSAQETETRYKRRYLPGQQLYLSQTHPQELAELVIDHNDPLQPFILNRKPAGS